MTTSLVGLSPWLCPASAPYFLPARVSKPALNAWQGRQNALWRGERERDKYLRLESACSVMERYTLETKTVLE